VRRMRIATTRATPLGKVVDTHNEFVRSLDLERSCVSWFSGPSRISRCTCRYFVRDSLLYLYFSGPYLICVILKQLLRLSFKDNLKNAYRRTITLI